MGRNICWLSSTVSVNGWRHFLFQIKKLPLACVLGLCIMVSSPGSVYLGNCIQTNVDILSQSYSTNFVKSPVFIKHVQPLLIPVQTEPDGSTERMNRTVQAGSRTTLTLLRYYTCHSPFNSDVSRYLFEHCTLGGCSTVRRFDNPKVSCIG